MISVAKAEQIILNTVKLFGVEDCPVQQACGRTLREDIKTDRGQPPFNKALVDGIAIAFSAWQNGARDFAIEKVIAAGDAVSRLKNVNNCVQIMTGAMVPANCDCLIPIERVLIKGKRACVKDPQTPRESVGQFIRAKAADAQKGDVVLRQGIRLEPPHIGIAVSVGKKTLKVTRQPRLAVIATGGELVDIGRPIKLQQTRLSNSYALQSLFLNSGLAKADMFHFPDDKKVLLSSLRRILQQYDMLVLSGGVSMGEFDYVPQVLAELKVKVLFHKVTQKPGKPFWFGKTTGGKAVFALPGNPVSTLVCAYRYVIPYLRKAAGLKSSDRHYFFSGNALKSSACHYFLPPAPPPGFTHFLFVKDGRIIPTGGSGDFSAMAKAEGFIEYDNSKRSQWPYFSWRI